MHGYHKGDENKEIKDYKNKIDKSPENFRLVEETQEITKKGSFVQIRQQLKPRPLGI